MPEEHIDRPVQVATEPQRHPAIRTLARACIALARWQRAQETAEPTARAEEPTARRTDDRAAEGHHD